MSDAGDSRPASRSPSQDDTIVAVGRRRELLRERIPDATRDRLRRRRAHARARRLAHARDVRPRALRGAGAARGRPRLHGDRAARRRNSLVGARPPRRATRTSCSRSPRRGCARLAAYGDDDRRGEVGLRALARRRAEDAARDPRASPSALPDAARPDVPRRARDPARVPRVARRARASTSSLLVHEMLPAVAAERLARFADVFCETGVYTVDESRDDPHRRASRRTGAQAPRRRADAVAAAPSSPRSSARRRPITSPPSRDAGIAALAAVRDRRHAASRHDALPREAKHAPARG